MYNSAVNNLSATGVCFDAGVQYIPTNVKDFSFGITMRNIGPSFSYRGDGLSIVLPVPTGLYTNSFQNRSEDFELPTQLAIGASKGFVHSLRPSGCQRQGGVRCRAGLEQMLRPG